MKRTLTLLMTIAAVAITLGCSAEAGKDQSADNTSQTAVTETAVATVGQPAPGFTLTDATGKSHSLSELKGKFVVLDSH
jgi:cytochrome oxidase Cu insertion factor (SCO1/SenC/PrrC family)